MEVRGEREPIQLITTSNISLWLLEIFRRKDKKKKKLCIKWLDVYDLIIIFHLKLMFGYIIYPRCLWLSCIISISICLRHLNSKPVNFSILIRLDILLVEVNLFSFYIFALNYRSNTILLILLHHLFNDYWFIYDH